MDDQSESDPREVEAGKYDLNYIGLDGNIACLGEDDSIEYKYPAICTVIWTVGYLDSWLFCTVKNLFDQSAARYTLLYPLCFSRLMRNEQKDLAEKKAVG